MPQRFNLTDLAPPLDAELAGLLGACPDIEPLRYSDNELIIRAGEMTDDIFLVLRGSCSVERAVEEGMEEGQGRGAIAVLQASPEAPVFVGEMAYLSSGFRSATVRSAMNVFALKFKPAHLDRIIDNHPALTRILCRQFAQRLLETNEGLSLLQQRFALPARQIRVAAGETIILQGTPAETLYQLVDGAAESESDAGSERWDAWQPTFLDAETFFKSGIYSRTIRASSPCLLVAVSQEHKAAIVRHYPELLLDLIAAQDTET